MNPLAPVTKTFFVLSIKFILCKYKENQIRKKTILIKKKFGFLVNIRIFVKKSKYVCNSQDD
jgi:hypothetical protein